MIRLLDILINLYIWAIIIRVVLSWFNVDRFNPVYKFLVEITEPPLRKIREIIPLVGGLDLSPLILIIALSLIRNLLYF